MAFWHQQFRLADLIAWRGLGYGLRFQPSGIRGSFQSSGFPSIWSIHCPPCIQETFSINITLRSSIWSDVNYFWPVGENFRLWIFSCSLEIFVPIKFPNSNFRFFRFQALQATHSGTHVGVIRTFWLMVHAPFTIKEMIRAYHIYRDIWITVIDKKLLCKEESGNLVITSKIFRRS